MKTPLLPLLATLSGLLHARAVLHLKILGLRQQLVTVARNQLPDQIQPYADMREAHERRPCPPTSVRR